MVVTVRANPDLLSRGGLSTMANLRRRLGVLPIAGLLLLACSSTAEDDSESGAEAQSDYPAGALIGVSMKSTVGVLLDDLKALPAAESSALEAKIIAKPADFWKERVRQQMRLTLQRQYFRHYYYGEPGETFADEKKTIA